LKKDVSKSFSCDESSEIPSEVLKLLGQDATGEPLALDSRRGVLYSYGKPIELKEVCRFSVRIADDMDTFMVVSDSSKL
jgi:hypothetical protein